MAMMKTPLFYVDEAIGEIITLSEETSRHISGVLRMKTGEQVSITDGKGNFYTTEIIEEHKRKCIVRRLSSSFVEPLPAPQTIAISLLKNVSRFEWFLEKATELGIATIVPLFCERSERLSFRHERMRQIVLSAMLQSQQVYLPALHKPVALNEFLHHEISGQKYIAHCKENQPKRMLINLLQKKTAHTVLIGPEGDFTDTEIGLSIDRGFIPVSLGTNRLRTETAGIAAAVLLFFSQQ